MYSDDYYHNDFKPIGKHPFKFADSAEMKELNSQQTNVSRGIEFINHLSGFDMAGLKQPPR